VDKEVLQGWLCRLCRHDCHRWGDGLDVAEFERSWIEVWFEGWEVVHSLKFGIAEKLLDCRICKMSLAPLQSPRIVGKKQSVTPCLYRVVFVGFHELEVARNWIIHLLRSVFGRSVVHRDIERQATKVLADSVELTVRNVNSPLPDPRRVPRLGVRQLEEVREEAGPGVVDFVGEDHHLRPSLYIVRAEAHLVY